MQPAPSAEHKLANLVIETAGNLPGEIIVTIEETDGAKSVVVKPDVPALTE